jgi:hypothetical protein
MLSSMMKLIKDGKSSLKAKKNSSKGSNRSKGSPESPNYNIPPSMYEEVKLNKSNFGIQAANEQQSHNESSDMMTDFVIVDYKEYEPYTREEWDVLLAEPELIQVDEKRLYVSLQRGIPKDLRKDIWLYLAGVDELKKENAKKGITYRWLLTQECKDQHNIEKDIPRTFPEHEFFKQERKDRLMHLENVLRAYAVFDPEVGYTQGMNFLVGTLIYYMHLEKREKEYFVIDREFEQDIFWILVHILQKKDWRSLYKDHTPKLIELLATLEERIKTELPKLYELFNEHALIPACFSQCFLTLLFYNSPFRFSKRVLDMFLFVGEEIILDLIVKMLTLCEKDILAKTEVEELYPFLRNELVKYTFEEYEDEFANLVAEQNVIRIIEYE